MVLAVALSVVAVSVISALGAGPRPAALEPGAVPLAYAPQSLPDRLVGSALPEVEAPEVSATGAPGPEATAAEDDEETAPAPVGEQPAVETSALPADSGEGRRVVFSQGLQRVWLVGEDDEVARTYLVSGSIHDNLDPGSYAVYSRSERATGIDEGGTMGYFVRFTRGERAAIGFHDIPMKNGAPVQTKRELGTPLSAGCIRQARKDAIALWEFAPIGTTVVVVA